MQVLWGGVVRGIGRVHISCFIFTYKRVSICSFTEKKDEGFEKK